LNLKKSSYFYNAASNRNSDEDDDSISSFKIIKKFKPTNIYSFENTNKKLVIKLGSNVGNNRLKPSPQNSLKKMKLIASPDNNDSEYFNSSSIKKPNKPLITLNSYSDSDKNDESLELSNIIILADDSELIRKSVKKLVLKHSEFKKYGIIECNDGIGILSKVASIHEKGKSVGLIITDEHMEYFCGSYAISKLTDLEKQNKIKKIFKVSLTAFVDEENKNNIFSKGAHMVLSKPLSLKDLDDVYVKYNDFLLNNF
jgi:CheY-like chemotaxis protein